MVRYGTVTINLSTAVLHCSRSQGKTVAPAEQTGDPQVFQSFLEGSLREDLVVIKMRLYECFGVSATISSSRSSCDSCVD